ncbi:hypothetical protein FPY71_08720 [Aureimonas fodinaquatilis]|uniref:Tetratricopeptide repeat protein n=1 Tax=Aureimonas fodinaquatilis TaxID=2565783 RepID=A0A5B0DX49_9HYPH|nr:tetratricopeptide repeat protein [Aureimonas fodinaquatilis]KAA0970572.1 hypothetical protein FPY71_08720 [Aureimonas fodinaquatilis]
MQENLKTLLANFTQAQSIGDKAGALMWAEKARDECPANVRSHVRVGQMLIGLDRLGDARLQLEEALKDFANDNGLLSVLAQVHTLAGNVDAALEVAQTLHRLHPGSSSFARLIRLHMRLRQNDKALLMAQEAVLQFPNDFSILLLTSAAFYQSGDLQAALNYGALARQIEPEKPDGYLREAQAAYGLEDFSHALRMAEAGLLASSTNLALLKIAAKSCMALERNDRALDYAQQCLGISPEPEPHHADAIQAAIRANRLDAAHAYAQRAKEKFPDSRVISNFNWVIAESMMRKPVDYSAYLRNPVASSSTKYVFTIPFNIKRFPARTELQNPLTGRLSEAWISYRIRIFMNFTCKCLINQSNQDFDAFLLCDPISFDFIKTEISKYYELPENIRMIDGVDHSDFLLKSMNGFERYCHTKLDSDNLYHREYVEYLHRHDPKPETQFLAFTKGYAFDANRGKTALYRATHEYFYARVGQVKTWTEDYKVLQPIGTTAEAKLIPHELVHEPAMFLITCHDSNVSNTTSLVQPTRTIHDPETLSDIWLGFTGETKPYSLQIAAS